MRQTNVCSNRVFVPGVHASPRRSEMDKEEEDEKKKQHALKNNFTERKHSIRCYQRNGWMDFSELQDIDSLNNEGTNTLVMGFRLKRMVL